MTEIRDIDGALVDAERPSIRNGLECVALAGKAGGLRTAALVLREAAARGSTVSFLSLAEAIEAAADRLDTEALAVLPLVAAAQ